MEPFIRNHQYNFIRQQAQTLVNGHATVTDQDVLKALGSLVEEKVIQLFSNLSSEQKWLLDPINDIQEKEDMERFLIHIKPYVIPFSEVNERTVKKLFPKAKKLKAPLLLGIDLRELSYVAWDDIGSQRRYLIMERDGELVGMSGVFQSSSKKGICSFCNRHEEIGLFLSETKGAAKETFVKRGNYICRDSRACNRSLTSFDKIDEFFDRLNQAN